MRPPCNPRAPEILLKSFKFSPPVNTSWNRTVDQKATLSKSPLIGTAEETKRNGWHNDFHYFYLDFNKMNTATNLMS